MVAKKAATKKPTKAVKKIASKHVTKKKALPMKSFRMYKDEKPFTRLKLTRQTLYWAILLAFVIVTQLWILQIQMDIAELTTILNSQ